MTRKTTKFLPYKALHISKTIKTVLGTEYLKNTKSGKDKFRLGKYLSFWFVCVYINLKIPESIIKKAFDDVILSTLLYRNNFSRFVAFKFQ